MKILLKEAALLGLDENDMFDIFEEGEIGFCGTCNEWYFGFNKCPCKTGWFEPDEAPIDNELRKKFFIRQSDENRELYTVSRFLDSYLDVYMNSFIEKYEETGVDYFSKNDILEVLQFRNCEYVDIIGTGKEYTAYRYDGEEDFFILENKEGHQVEKEVDRWLKNSWRYESYLEKISAI